MKTKAFIRKLAALWREPYPSTISPWQAVAVSAAIVFIVLYFLQPFGLSSFGGSKLFASAVSAAISAAVSAVFAFVLPRLFPSLYADDRWTVGKDILNTLAMLLLIAVGVWLFVAWLSGVAPTAKLFSMVVLWVFVLALFPVTLFAFWHKNILLARNLREATELNRRIVTAKAADGTPESEVCSLTFGIGARERLEIGADSFVYAEAEGNYVRLIYLSADGGKADCKTLRLTMKQAEEAVAGCPYIVRCHRAFIVNVRKVVRVDGNSQGYRLSLCGCKAGVPVSRAYAKAVKQLMENGKQA